MPAAGEGTEYGRARAKPSPVAELDAVVDRLEELSARPEELSEAEAGAYEAAVGQVLRRTAEVARHVYGALPSTWSHYISARRAFASDSALASVLGVNRSRVTRWKQGAAADPENEARLRDLAIVVSLLSDYLDRRAIPDWLHGHNPHLGHRRPVDLLRAGRLSEVVAAIEAEKAGAHA